MDEQRDAIVKEFVFANFNEVSVSNMIYWS